jgi:hypothetical protein
VPATHDTRQPRDVVEVEVGDREQRDLVDAEVAKAAVDRNRLGASIYFDGRTRTGRQEQRVALPDIACGEHPSGRRPRRSQ